MEMVKVESGENFKGFAISPAVFEKSQNVHFLSFFVLINRPKECSDAVKLD